MAHWFARKLVQLDKKVEEKLEEALGEVVDRKLDRLLDGDPGRPGGVTDRKIEEWVDKKIEDRLGGKGNSNGKDHSNRSRRSHLDSEIRHGHHRSERQGFEDYQTAENLLSSDVSHRYHGEDYKLEYDGESDTFAPGIDCQSDEYPRTSRQAYHRTPHHSRHQYREGGHRSIYGRRHHIERTYEQSSASYPYHNCSAQDSRRLHDSTLRTAPEQNGPGIPNTPPPSYRSRSSSSY